MWDIKFIDLPKNLKHVLEDKAWMSKYQTVQNKYQLTDLQKCLITKKVLKTQMSLAIMLELTLMITQ